LKNKRFERSACPERREAKSKEAVEPFDRTQGRLFEWLEPPEGRKKDRDLGFPKNNFKP
jgi:hypothetical protein